MVEYGKISPEIVTKKKNPPLTIFGITFGESSFRDYEADTKLKVPQKDLLIFFQDMYKHLQNQD